MEEISPAGIDILAHEVIPRCLLLLLDHLQLGRHARHLLIQLLDEGKRCNLRAIVAKLNPQIPMSRMCELQGVPCPMQSAPQGGDEGPKRHDGLDPLVFVIWDYMIVPRAVWFRTFVSSPAKLTFTLEAISISPSLAGRKEFDAPESRSPPRHSSSFSKTLLAPWSRPRP